MRPRVHSSDEDVQLIDDNATVSSGGELPIKQEPVTRQGRNLAKGPSTGPSTRSSRSRAASRVPESEPEEMQVNGTPSPEEEEEEEDPPETSFRPPAQKGNLFNRNDVSPPRALSTPAELKGDPKQKATRHQSVPLRDVTQRAPPTCEATGNHFMRHSAERILIRPLLDNP